MFRVALLLLLIGFTVCANAQHQGDVWVFANGNRLDFNGYPPQVSNGTEILPTDVEVEGVVSISDANGDLLFYSDGVKLWDWLGNVITGSLMGHQSSTNSAYIVSVPSSSDQFYLFTLDAMQNNLTNGLRYSVVKACRDDGVSVLTSNELLSENMTEKMTAVRHANGIDYWLITHEFGNDVFKVFLVNSQGITLSGTQSCGLIHGPSLSAAVGQIKASPDGSVIALNVTNNKWTDIVSFDKANGSIECVLSFPPDTSETGSFRAIYGLSFSPSGRYLYISGGSRFRLWQFDVSLIGQSFSAFYASKVVLSDDDFQSGTSFHQLQLGSDGKIYCSSWNNEHLAVIHEPDIGGLSCAFEDSAIVLQNLGNYGLPAFVDSYDYSISGICDTSVGINEQPIRENALTIYPNPTTTQTKLTYSTPQGRPTMQLADMLGRVVHKVQLPSHEGSYTLDASTLGTGVYFCTLLSGAEVVATQKLVVAESGK